MDRIQVLSTFARTDRIQVLSTFALTNNSGTVYVRVYKQFRYCLRSHLQTIQLQSTFALTVYVRTYKKFRYCLRSHLQTIKVLSTFALTNN